MRNTTLGLACISLVMLFSAAPLSASEKKTVFNTQSMKYESGTGVERCRDKCGRRSGPDVKSLLSQGWSMVSSSPKEVIAEQYWHAGCNTCLPHGCVCIGTEYVLQREEPAPKPAAGSTAGAATPKHGTAVVPPPEVKALTSERNLLNQEIERLKQENAALKQENEALRNRLKSVGQ